VTVDLPYQDKEGLTVVLIMMLTQVSWKKIEVLRLESQSRTDSWYWRHHLFSFMTNDKCLHCIDLFLLSLQELSLHGNSNVGIKIR